MAERRLSLAGIPISVGVALIGIGCMLAWIWPDGVWRDAAAAPLAVGLCFLAWGVYLLVDVVERAARKIIGRE